MMASSLKDYPIDGFFKAPSYAIVGASSKKGSLGLSIASNFIEKYHGDVFFVNPKGGEMFGKPIYKTVKDVDHEIQGAVVVVAAKFVPQTMKDLMEKGAKWITLVTGGFAESKTKEGKEAQNEIVRLANQYKCRIIGPNCMGVYDPTNVDTLFLPAIGLAKPGFGPVGVFSQSGALGVTLLNELAGRNNQGWISKFISFGNACDVDELDALRYYTTEPTIKQIWSYLEGFHNGPAFMRAVQKTTMQKPVLLIKANRGKAGAKASASHSASLAANDAVCDQLLKNSGVIRCDVWKDMQNIGTVLRHQPLPQGRRVAIVTDAGGFGVLIADAVDQYKLKLVDFTPDTVKRFRSTFPPYYQCANPMDLTGSAKTDDMIKAGHLALEDPNIDVVVMGLQPIAPGLADADVMAKTLIEHFGPGKTKKPFMVVEFGGKYPDDRTIRTMLKEAGMAVYPGGEEALRVLNKLVSYKEYLDARKSVTSETYPEIDVRQVNALFDKVLQKGRTTLTEIEGYDVFSLCGIKTPAYKLFTSGKEAGDFVEQQLRAKPGKFVAKVVSPDIIHKTDVGGVSLNIKDGETASRVVEAMNAKFSKQAIEYHGIMVSEMVPKGLEMMIGANRDATFGPITVSGLGGVLVEVLKDVVFNMCPVSVEDATLSLKNLKNERLVNGFRGQPALNKQLFAQYTSSISRIMSECPQVSEIDINPLIQGHDGSLTAVDSVFRLKH